MKKMNNIINKLLIPLCGTVVAVCIFIANASPNLCLGIWGYEEDMPDELKDKWSILQVLCKYKIVQKNLFKWTELNSVRFYVIRKISTCQ